METPANTPAGRMYGLPLDTPLETEPNVGKAEAGEMWRVALLNVGLLGAWDREIAAWIDGKDAGIIATVASLLRRAGKAGVVAGRREILDETGSRDLTALADDIRGLADHADWIFTEGESGAQDVLEALLDGVRRTVNQHATDPGHLAEVAARARRRYFSVLAGDLSSAQRQTAVTIAVDMARTSLLADSTLAAAVRAVVDADRELDDAIGDLELDDDALPGHPVRSVVLPVTNAGLLMKALDVPEEGHRVQWAPRADGRVDVRISPADYTHLQDSDDDGPYIAEDGMLTVADGARYELTVGWPRRDAGTECRYCPADVLADRVARWIAADSQVDAVRGYDGTDGGAS
jgi:hypothetical protein